MSKATQDVLAERQRQIDEEMRTHKHDDEHINGALVAAAACYLLHENSRNPFKLNWFPFWPWGPRFWKPKTERENYVRAAALVIAEIERLDRR